MANPSCMFEGCATPAVFVGTFFEDGNTVTVCGNHFVEFAAGTLEAMTGAPVIDFINGIIPDAEAVVASLETDPNDPGPTSPESSEVGTDDILVEEDLMRCASVYEDDIGLFECVLRLGHDGVHVRAELPVEADVTDAEFHPVATD
jgi:hypothetical protein